MTNFRKKKTHARGPFFMGQHARPGLPNPQHLASFISFFIEFFLIPNFLYVFFKTNFAFKF